MKKFFVLLLCLSASFGFNMAQTCGKGIKVLQLNLWGGTSKVSDGYQGFLDLLEEVDPDIVFLCEISGGQKFVHRVIQDMKQRGKLYYGEAFDLAVGFLSKIHPEKVQKLCTVPGNEERTMVKFLVAAGGKEVAFYSCHLDHRHYECYMPRGYSGTTWKKIDKPVTDEQAVLAANRLAYRDESVAAFLVQGCCWMQASGTLIGRNIRIRFVFRVLLFLPAIAMRLTDCLGHRMLMSGTGLILFIIIRHAAL